MGILHSSKAYVFNLHATSSAEAKRLWRRDVKEKWDWECAYCGDNKNLTIDHVIPVVRVGQISLRMLSVVVTLVIKEKVTNLGRIGILVKISFHIKDIKR